MMKEHWEGYERIVTEDNEVEIHLRDGFQEWNFPDPEEKAAAFLIGQFILQEAVRGLFVVSHVEDDGSLRFGVQGLGGGDIDIRFDPTLAIDWLMPPSPEECQVETRAEGEAILAWLEDQARKVKQRLAVAFPQCVKEA